jgi:hypothetical protein
MMDAYYARLTRETLSEAQAKIVAAQDHMIRGDAPQAHQKKARRILKEIASLQEEILYVTEAPGA